jgi:hypothetical protein
MKGEDHAPASDRNLPTTDSNCSEQKPDDRFRVLERADDAFHAVAQTHLHEFDGRAIVPGGGQ